jgi:hypothetical protein
MLVFFDVLRMQKVQHFCTGAFGNFAVFGSVSVALSLREAPGPAEKTAFLSSSYA